MRRLAALRAYESAQSLCPDAETERALAELRAHFAADRGVSAAALLEQARSAERAGDAGRAHDFQERAVHALESSANERLAAWVPSPGPRETEIFWLSDSQALVERDRDGIRLRRRDAWYPEFATEAYGNQGIRQDALLAGDGRTLVVPVEFEGGGDPPNDRPTELAMVEVAPGAGFGRERARFRVHGRHSGYSEDGRHYVLAEPVSQRGSVPAHDELLVLDGLTFATRHRIAPPPGESAGTTVNGLALGKRFALVQWSGRVLSIVNLETGAVLTAPGPDVAIPTEPLSPDERFAFWTADSATKYFVQYEIATGSTRTVGDPDCEMGTRLRFDPTSRVFVAGGSKGLACVFDLASGRLLRKLRPRPESGQSYVGPGRFTPNGAGIFVAYGSNPATLFDLRSGRELPTGIAAPMGVLWAKDSNGIVVGRDGRLATVAADLKTRAVTPSLHPAGQVTSAHTRRDGIALEFAEQWLVVDPRTGSARVHDLPLSTELSHTEDDTFVASSARGATSEIFGKEGGRAPGSPIALAKFEGVHREGSTLVVRAKDVEWRWSAAPGFTRTARLPEPSRPCAEPRFHAGAERFVVEVANLETYEEGRL
ncbi:MAG TPA: hypothetical protein VGK73_09980, partial [Polyangiaceae bacterium]